MTSRIGLVDRLPPHDGRCHLDLLMGSGWVRLALLDETADVHAITAE